MAYDSKSWVAGVWTQKSGNGRTAPTSVRRFGEAACFQPHSQSGLRLEELAVGVWTQKSGNGRSAPLSSETVQTKKLKPPAPELVVFFSEVVN
ncbi:hypothetical protein CXF70_04490 [Planomicrobium sp. MB-3u-38]|nr:hypothetical protein CXF70_04490 [Planomicrobium sp. MB-3u-38]